MTNSVLKSHTWVPFSADKMDLISKYILISCWEPNYQMNSLICIWYFKCERSERWEQRHGPASVNRRSATSCNSYLLRINLSSTSPKNTHRNLCWEGEADTCWQHHQSATTTSSIHFFSEDTTTIIQRAKCPLRQGDKLQDNTHSPWRCRTDIPLIPHHASTRTTKTTHTSRGWGVLGTELHLVPSPFFLAHPFWDTNEWHIEAGQSLHLHPHCLHQMETDTSEDTASTQTDVSGRLCQYNRWRILILTSRPRSHF